MSVMMLVKRVGFGWREVYPYYVCGITCWFVRVRGAVGVGAGLTVSFYVVVFIPIILADVILINFGGVRLGTVGGACNVRSTNVLTLASAIRFLGGIAKHACSRLRGASLVRPSELLSDSCLAGVGGGLRGGCSCLVIGDRKRLVFGNKVSGSSVLEGLPQVSGGRDDSSIDDCVSDSSGILVGRLGFHSDSNSRTDLCVIASATYIVPRIEAILVRKTFTLMLVLLAATTVLVI